MVTRKKKIIAGSGALLVLAAAGTWYGFSLFATQGQGTLAQAPLNKQVSTTPALIMAVDDSGSMTFQTQFRGQDGEVCWSTGRGSFYNTAGQLNEARDLWTYDRFGARNEDRFGNPILNGYCSYYYVLPGDRVNNYYGVPQLDVYGFARSPTYNPTYFDPTVKYEPWMRSQGTGSDITFSAYPQASKTATRIDPRNATTINLTANRFGTTAGDAVLMQPGMVIPQNVRYRTMVVNNEGQVTSTGSIQSNTGRNGTTWGNNATRASIEYVPATFFMPWTGTNDAYPQMAGTANVYSGVTRTKVDNACGTNCPMWKYTIASSNDAAIQNFANWYSFYGNRNRAMIAGMTRAMDVNRLHAGYFKINENGSYDSATEASKRLTIRDLSNPVDKAALYTQMIALTASGGTPNRQAVNAAGMQYQRTDAGAPIKASCQKNAVMLFTDGFSNGGGPDAVGNQDQNMGVPFSDAHSNTMADIVSQYYNSPLRTDDAMPRGKVPVPEVCSTTTDKSIDCKTDLHINFYGITLGARGNLYNPDNPQNPYTTPAIYENWPSRQDNNNSTVDDIWHASVNTRGEYINAKTPAEITEALKRVLTAVSAGAQLSGGQGLTGARIGAGSLTVTPSYNITNQSTDWSGTLQAARVSINTDRTASFTNTWEASAKMAAQSVAGRRIIASKNGVATTFDANNIALDDLCTKPGNLYTDMRMCNAAEVRTLNNNSSTALSDSIAYLRGSTAMEKRNNGVFRTRSTILGDIVNSSPVIASPLDDYGYRRLGGDVATSYATFLAGKREDARYMVYVGANDGMLHAFDGGMNGAGVTDDNGGNESFAYIPATALGHMGMLLFPYKESDKALQKFQHRYYVDGPITVADAQVNDEWATTLVGTAGAGGRAVFGLDVTNPSSFDTGNRLWEISDINMDLAEGIRNNIGHVLNKPVIVPVREGDGVAWKAIFGNGVNSANGRAVLFVVDMSSGEARMIEAVEDSATAPAGTNGLNSIVVVDRWRPNTADNPPQGQEFVRGRDGLADTVYGADQRGAVWKFDLNSSAESVTVPLFTTARQTNAQNVVHRQPIMGGMTVVTGLGDGVMLLLGTGSFSFDGEQTDTTQQSLYGVNDINAGQPATTLTPANLFPYTVEEENEVRTLEAGTFSGASSGWQVSLPGSGERFIGNPTVSSGIVFMPTYLPSPPETGCGVDGNNWLFGLNPLSGSAALSNVRIGSPTGSSPGEGTAATKLNTGGSSPVKDVNVAVVPRPEGGGAGPGGHACWMVVNVAGSAPLYMPYPCGRQSWRQVQ